MGQAVDGSAVVASICWISPQELRGKLSRIELVKIGISGRRPPIGCRRHRGLRKDTVMDSYCHPREQNNDARMRRNTACQWTPGGSKWRSEESTPSRILSCAVGPSSSGTHSGALPRSRFRYPCSVIHLARARWLSKARRARYEPEVPVKVRERIGPALAAPDFVLDT